MRIPARALKPLVAMAIAAASFGCIAPAAYAENATAAVISDEALKAFEVLMTTNDIIIRSAFYYILLPSLFATALPLLLYELLELHDRRRL